MIDKNFEPELQECISAGQTLRILVVDDSKTVRSAIRDRLELGNLEVTEASSGEQALAIIGDKQPDLVLLDIVMPGMDGITVLKILRESCSKYQLPVIPLTSSDSSSEIVQALDSGANDYITKPIDFDVLWARLSNQLMQKQAAEYLRFAQASLEQQISQRTAELSSSNKKLKRVIQERLLAEDRLQRQANYDELTGLPNRSLARDRLGQTIAKAKRQSLSPCVAFLDLDNFKSVNDSLGHAAGDELLRAAAKRLSACARKCDTVARLGGDEFLLILEDCDEQARDSRERDLQRIGERIIESFSRPFVLDGNEISVSPSIGFAIYPRDGNDGNEIMRNADAAMYRAKNDGKNTYCSYSPDLTAKARLRMRVESLLRLALERNEISLLYQPIVETCTGNAVKAETLLCWNNVELGRIPADVFVNVAEDTGLIVPIGNWQIRTACEQVRKWRDCGVRHVSVTVNVSTRQLQSDAGLCQTIKKALHANGLTADALQLELKEGVLRNETPATMKTIAQLEKIGVRLLIGDFGTGYASLSDLQRYRFDTVKIDRSISSRIADSVQDADLVKAVVAMASSLGMAVVTDGVTTSTQLEFLLDANCQYVQGPYFSKPLVAEDFEALLEQTPGHPRIKPLVYMTAPVSSPGRGVAHTAAMAENIAVTSGPG